MLYFFASMIIAYLLISVLVASVAEIFGEFLLSLIVLVVAVLLIFRYLI